MNPVGIDLSRVLLEKAAGPAPLVRADMRAVPIREEVFEAAFSFFTSFGYFESDEEDMVVLEDNSIASCDRRLDGMDERQAHNGRPGNAG